MIQNNEKRIGCPLPSMGEKEENMKIDITASIETDSDSDKCYIRMKTDYESNAVCVGLKKIIRSIRVIPEAGCGLISIDIKEDICK